MYTIEKYENELIILMDQIYEKYGNSNEVTDAVWNYTMLVRWMITILDNEELYKRWKDNLTKLLKEKIILTDFIKLKTKESKILDELLRDVLSWKEELTDTKKQEIITEFKKLINNN